MTFEEHAAFDGECLQRFAISFPLSPPNMRMGSLHDTIGSAGSQYDLKRFLRSAVGRARVASSRFPCSATVAREVEQH